MNESELYKLTGISFKQKGSKFYASCYMDGSPHTRWDKLTVRKAPDGQLVFEEAGGDCIGVKQWLKLYGDESKYVRPDRIDAPPKIERKFVPDKVFRPTFPKLYTGNLFKFLSSRFGVLKTHETFRKYCVGEDPNGNTIFWYRNESGQWLHDVVIPYETDGKRDKNSKFPSWRKCKVGDGYTGRSMFGQHLLKDHKGEVCIVESEKTALIMSMSDTKGRLWLACGGSNKTANIRDGWKLFPDFDEAGKWWECVGCDNTGKAGCIIDTVEVDGRKKKVKNWGCDFANKNLVQWFSGLEVEVGGDVGDYVLNNLNK